VLQYLFAVRGTPELIRSDNLGNDTGPEFVSKVICRWLKQADVKTLFIAKGSPWENGYVESFNGTLRDELLNREIFLSFEEACWVIDRWRLDYNHHRIHSSLDCQTPAAYAARCVLPASATPQPPEHSRFTNPNPLTQPGAKTGGESLPLIGSCMAIGTTNMSTLLSNTASVETQGRMLGVAHSVRVFGSALLCFGGGILAGFAPQYPILVGAIASGFAGMLLISGGGESGPLQAVELAARDSIIFSCESAAETRNNKILCSVGLCGNWIAQKHLARFADEVL
jgi:hypothetical protein